MDDKGVKAVESLQKLTACYAKRLPHLVKTVEELWEKQLKKPNDGVLTELVLAVHSLNGTAGTYGFKGIHELAREIEKELGKYVNQNNDSQLIQKIECLIADLQQISYVDSVSSFMPQWQSFEKQVVGSCLIYVLLPVNTDHSVITQLNFFKYEVKLLESVDALMDAVQQTKPALLIIDIDYFDRLSLEAIQQLKDALISIIYIGDSDNLEARLQAVRFGGQGFMGKPLDITALLRLIDNIFQARNLEHERILIVDDSEHLAEYYACILNEAKMLTKIVNNPLHFLSVLQEFQPDLILMDINMPHCSGVELAQVVNQQESLSSIPIVFLSTISERTKQLELLSIAGDDFLTKPVEPKHLLAAVHNRLLRMRMLRSRMMRDSLTNLYNHTMILNHLDREILIAERGHNPLTVCLIDIDHFKATNDNYGHQAGDAVLRNLSNLLRTSLRKTDLIGRYGGEEFLIILPDADLKHAEKIINDIRIAFAIYPHDLNGQTIHCTFSAGLATLKDFKTNSDMVKAADEALYRAKEAGRNRVCLTEVN